MEATVQGTHISHAYIGTNQRLKLTSSNGVNYLSGELPSYPAGEFRYRLHPLTCSTRRAFGGRKSDCVGELQCIPVERCIDVRI